MEDSIFKQVKSKLNWLTTLLIVFSFFINILVLSVPLYMLQIYNRVITSYSVDTLILLTIIVLVALLTMTILDVARAYLSKAFGFWMDAKLSTHMIRQTIQFKMVSGKGYTAQTLKDLQSIKQFLASQSPYPLLDAPWTPLFIVFVYFLHPILGHIALVGAVLLLVLGIVNELVVRKSLQESETQGLTSMRNAEVAAQNADSLLGMGMMNDYLSQWYQSINQTNEIEQQAASKSIVLANVSKFVRSTLQIVLLGSGAWLVIQTQLSAGAMIAASILMGRALAPMEQAIGTWRVASAAYAAYQRLNEIHTKVQFEELSMPLPRPKGHFELTGVLYRHPGSSDNVLAGITCSIPPGCAVGLIGSSGTGKSTLAKLLLGNLRPLAGKITLDGMEVSKWSSDDLGQHCGYLPQDIELFPGTIRENIARLKLEDPEKVIRAAQIASCHELILKKNKGYDFVIGEGGRGLSGGERQRIALARAIYNDPSVVVFDEASANLDGEGEIAYQKVIEHLKKSGSTVIVIAHNPSTMRHMDRLLYIADGQIRLYGGREEVLKRLMGQPKPDIPRVENG